MDARNADVVRPWVNGQDISGRPRGLWIIDFGADMPERGGSPVRGAVRVRAPARVKPVREPSRRAARYAERWWLHVRAAARACARALSACRGSSRRPQLAKHRLFVWLPSRVLPDQRLIVVRPRRRLHVRRPPLARPRGVGARHRDPAREVESGLRYTPTTCFETFPFPRPTDEQREAIAAAARELVRLRDGWLNPPGLDPAELGKRTLTNLYNARPTWLAARPRRPRHRRPRRLRLAPRPHRRTPPRRPPRPQSLPRPRLIGDSRATAHSHQAHDCEQKRRCRTSWHGRRRDSWHRTLTGVRFRAHGTHPSRRQPGAQR